MKTKKYKVTATFYFILLCNAFLCSAQDSAQTIAFNKVTYFINSIGGLGFKNKGIEFPSNSGKYLLHSFDLWISGSNNTQIFAVGSSPYFIKSDWAKGPISLDGKTMLLNKNWKGINSFNQTDINFHINNYKKNGYVIANNIAKFSANGQNGFATILYPFGDLNSNSKYEPELGEFPFILGNNAVFTMCGDSAKNAFKKNITGLEISTQYFNINHSDSVINNAVFCRFTICNRSINNYTDARLSGALDFAIGKTDDNLLRTVINQNAIVCYNQKGGDPVYGNNPPALAFAWLNKKIGSSMYMVNSNTDAVRGVCKDSSHFYNFARGKWKTGQALGFGGEGLDNATNTSNFVYNEQKIPSQNVNWLDENAGQKTGISSTESFTINAGECKVIDAVFIILPNADSQNMQKNFTSVFQFYYAQNFSLKNRKNNLLKNYYQYDLINKTIQLNNDAFLNKNFTLYNLQGKKIVEENIDNKKIQLPPLTSGYYLFQIDFKHKELIYIP